MAGIDQIWPVLIVLQVLGIGRAFYQPSQEVIAELTVALTAEIFTF